MFAQKKTKSEVEAWNSAWDEASKEWQSFKTRVENLIAVYDGLKQKAKLPSVRDLTPEDETAIIRRMLKAYITVRDDGLSARDLVQKYRSELDNLCTFDKDTQDTFGYVNTWWVFGEVASKLNYVVFSEDDCTLQSEDAQITLNCFRKFALLLHKHYISNLSKKPSIKSNMLNCLMNDNLLLNVISC